MVNASSNVTLFVDFEKQLKNLKILLQNILLHNLHSQMLENIIITLAVAVRTAITRSVKECLIAFTYNFVERYANESSLTRSISLHLLTVSKRRNVSPTLNKVDRHFAINILFNKLSLTFILYSSQQIATLVTSVHSQTCPHCHLKTKKKQLEPWYNDTIVNIIGIIYFNNLKNIKNPIKR
ncbi:hypothetical protein AGLY_011864 [Aphis glycines]|uniref:Uncharacterized protein n=1 Tax=Aphis glycines TaxID=307491 RepID=A0A6G0TCC4_APHGL|nr:hypothetical protein AGLY_011864 [Aphis glycines]